MTDYVWSTGTTGKMMIRDTGSTIEFWLDAGNGTTWTDHLPWSGTVNGSGVGGSYYYHAGSGWNRIGVWGVSSSQTVTFAIGATGTSGFGGPSSHSQAINRATVPPAPQSPQLSNVTSTSIDVTYGSNGDGGASVDDWVLGYGTDPGYPQVELHHTVTTTVSGLTPGVTYYFWAHGHNSQGWGPWSARSQATTLRVPDAPSAATITDISQIGMLASFTANYDGGTAITGFEVWWSKTNSLPGTDAVSGFSPQILPNLDPGTVYYIWVRTQNAIGYSGWSPVTVAKTIAGASVKVDAEWKDAVPYVRSGGVWKLARPWVKVAGDWKEAS